VSIQSATLSSKTHPIGLLEIDHVFICVSVLPTASLLQEAGFVNAEPTLFQPDRGTVSQVIFFETMYIEFIEVVDDQAAQRFAAKTGIDFIRRCQWRQSQASPFGVALRRRAENGTFVRSRRLLQQIQLEHPDHLRLSFSPENLSMQSVPLCFVVPESLALPSLIDCQSERYRQKVAHPLGMERLTHTMIRGSLTHAQSQPFQMLQSMGVLMIEESELPLLELTFDHHQQRKQLDWQCLDLPLMLRF
jgi:Glyoxalase-like domain